MPTPAEIANKHIEDFEHFVRDPEKRVKQLIRKITHSGETDLDQQDLDELKKVCKVSKNDLMVLVYKECMTHLHKKHSQVRVSTIKLFDYLFQKSHVLRDKLLSEFDTFIELTLAITQRSKVQLKLPPPKQYAALLPELAAKMIYRWHADFGEGYEKIRYAYRFLREHGLVDFTRFQVNTREQLIKQQKLAEQQEKILSRAIENRLKELQELKPEFEKLLAQIQSLIEILVPDTLSQPDNDVQDANNASREFEMQKHGFANMAQNITIEFGPFVEIRKDEDNKEIVQNLKELKKELIDGKLTKLIAIEKTISKRSDQMVTTLREIIDLKNRATNIVLKLGELQIVNEDAAGIMGRGKKSTLDNAESDSDDESDFAEVEPKEGLESYIPKSMRFEYGLEPIDPRELQAQNHSITLTDDKLLVEQVVPSTSKASDQSGLVMACNVRLESGKLCPRRDKVKCPFHGRIIPRDHLGVPLNEEHQKEEEERNRKLKKDAVPEWQDPQLLAEIKAATGVDLTMPAKGPGGRTKKSPNKILANPKICDSTPKQRLRKKLKLMIK